MDWKPSKLTREQLEARRLEAGRLLKEGRLLQGQIAKQLGVRYLAVSYWAKRYRSGGLRQLCQRVATDCPAKLTPTRVPDLVQLLALYHDGELEAYAVSRVVNAPGRDHASPIERTE